MHGTNRLVTIKARFPYLAGMIIRGDCALADTETILRGMVVYAAEFRYEVEAAAARARQRPFEPDIDPPA